MKARKSDPHPTLPSPTPTEPIVTAVAPRVVYASGGIVVVDKPAGLPVHPAGRYHEQTLVTLLSLAYAIDPQSFAPREAPALTEATRASEAAALQARAMGWACTPSRALHALGPGLHVLRRPRRETIAEAAARVAAEQDRRKTEARARAIAKRDNMRWVADSAKAGEGAGAAEEVGVLESAPAPPAAGPPTDKGEEMAAPVAVPFELHPVHRLDRCTSGLVLFGRGGKRCAALAQCFKGGAVVKVYLARVEGRFPASGEEAGLLPCGHPCDETANSTAAAAAAAVGRTEAGGDASAQPFLCALPFGVLARRRVQYTVPHAPPARASRSTLTPDASISVARLAVPSAAADGAERKDAEAGEESAGAADAGVAGEAFTAASVRLHEQLARAQTTHVPCPDCGYFVRGHTVPATETPPPAAAADWSPGENKTATAAAAADASPFLGQVLSACSVFRRLSYDGRTSLVECRPLTGRMHQLRLHLWWLGHPIANDPCYGGALWRSNAAQDLPVHRLMALPAGSARALLAGAQWVRPHGARVEGEEEKKKRAEGSRGEVNISDDPINALAVPPTTSAARAAAVARATEIALPEAECALCEAHAARTHVILRAAEAGAGPSTLSSAPAASLSDGALGWRRMLPMHQCESIWLHAYRLCLPAPAGLVDDSLVPAPPVPTKRTGAGAAGGPLVTLRLQTDLPAWACSGFDSAAALGPGTSLTSARPFPWPLTGHGADADQFDDDAE